MVEYNGSLPTFALNPYSWTRVSSILFVDAPIGSGFSYSRSTQGSSDILFVDHMYSFLTKWLICHPEFISIPFYIGGDSFSGMIIPVLAEVIAKGIEAKRMPAINFKGYLLGNPSTDSKSDNDAWVTYAHRQALIPNELYKLTEKINHEYVLEPQCRPISDAYSKMADHQKALLEWSEESHIKLNSMYTSRNPKFQGLGFPEFGCRFYENLLLHVWANDVNVQKALRVHKRIHWMRCNSSSLPYRKYFQGVVSYHLSLNNRGYRALTYSGDHDMTVPYLRTVGWIRSLNLTIVDRWRPWLVDDEVAGYSTEYSNDFTFTTVKGGGHTAPEYKSKECFVMFKREEKRRKLHEAVLNMLHPPPSPPPKDEPDNVPLSILGEDFEADGLGESGSSATSGEDNGNDESEPQRLTRAQRKRLRKKKLKEDASRRKEIIGPLLPSAIDHCDNEAQGVRRNASEKPGTAVAEEPGDEPPACSNQNKVKQRRKAKKQAREREQV